MNEKIELKPIVFNDSDENDIHLIVADNWNLQQTKHVFISFILTAIILLFISIITPDGKNELYSITKLPIYAYSCSFDVKLHLSEITPFSQQVSVFARLISEDIQKKVILNGTLRFQTFKNNKYIRSNTIPFHLKTFIYTDRSAYINFVELYHSDIIFYDSFDLITHFDSSVKDAVYLEFKTITTSTNFTYFDIWCRCSFSICLFIVLLRHKSFKIMNEGRFK